MDRRAFLRTSALVAGTIAGANVLAACNRGGGSGEVAIPDGEPELAPVVAQFELLTTNTRAVPFGLRTLDNVPVEEVAVTAFLRDIGSKEVIGGPYETTYTTEGGAGGLYLAPLELTEAGQFELVAVTEDGRYGTRAIPVVAPEDSNAPVPGAAAISTPTATTDDDRGLATICTAEPQCGMHEVSLDEALADGRPVVAVFATPAYCQTAVCGPAVEIVERTRDEGDFGDDIAWIHIEIYSDEGQTVAEPVAEWNLPSEPWLYTIGTDGKIADRLDGPMLPDFVADMASGLQSA